MHSLSVWNHSLTYDLKSNTEVKSRHKRAQKMQHLAESFYLTVYQTQSKWLSRFMVSSRWKYETDIASFSTSNPKMFFAHAQPPNCLPVDGSGFYRQRPRNAGIGPLRVLRCRLPHWRRATYSSTAISMGMMGFPVLTSCFAHSPSDICKNQGPDELPP